MSMLLSLLASRRPGDALNIFPRMAQPIPRSIASELAGSLSCRAWLCFPP